MQVTTIGLDIARNVFQVHGIDAAEKVVVRKQLRRRDKETKVQGVRSVRATRKPRLKLRALEVIQKRNAERR